MKQTIKSFLKFGTIVSTYGLILSVVFQILARFFLPSAPSWTEEASRMFFIYAIAFSAGLAYESGDYVYLEFFFEKIPAKLKTPVLISIGIGSVFLFLLVAFYSIEFILLGHLERSPGLGIRMSFVFLSVFILAAGLCYFICLGLVKRFQKSKK